MDLTVHDAPALVVSAPAGLVLAANEAFCRHSGYKEEEILSTPLRSLQPMTMAGSLIAALQAQQAGSGVSHDLEHLDCACSNARLLTRRIVPCAEQASRCTRCRSD